MKSSAAPRPMSEVQVASVLLALEVTKELLRETPYLQRSFEDAALADVSFMESVSPEGLEGILSDRITKPR